MSKEPLQVHKSGKKALAAGERFPAAKLRTLRAVRWGRTLLGSLTLAACGACSSDLPPAPADLLAPAVLVPLLADLHIAEARAQHSARATDTIQALYQQQEALIFQRRELTPRQFQESFAYYAARPAELEAIYATLTDTLAMRQVRIQTTEEKGQPRGASMLRPAAARPPETLQ